MSMDEEGKTHPYTKWSMVNLLRFIDLYREQPVLWNTNHEKHKDRNSRNKALLAIRKEISQYMPFITVDDMKKKIHSLRSQFARELKTMQRKSETCTETNKDAEFHDESGDGDESSDVSLVGKVSKPKLWCYNELLFLVNGDNFTPVKREPMEDEQDERSHWPVNNVKFVKAIEKYPWLYNRRLQYTKPAKINEAWRAVSAETGETVRNCKIRWKNLRSVFVRKLKQSEASEGRTKPYYLENAMQFILPFVRGSYYPYDENISKSDAPTSPDQISNCESETREMIDQDALNDSDEVNSDSSVKRKKIDNTREDDNPRKQFLLSILPDVQEMNTSQYRSFRMLILKAVDTALEEEPQNNISHMNS